MVRKNKKADEGGKVKEAPYEVLWIGRTIKQASSRIASPLIERDGFEDMIYPGSPPNL